MDIDFISHGYLVKSHIFQKFFISLRKWGISFDDDVVFFAEFNCVFINIQRMSLNLIHDWFHFGILHKCLEMSSLKVTHTSSHELLFFDSLLQSRPAAVAIFDINGVAFLYLFLGTWPEEEHAV